MPTTIAVSRRPATKFSRVMVRRISANRNETTAATEAASLMVKMPL